MKPVNSFVKCLTDQISTSRQMDANVGISVFNIKYVQFKMFVRGAGAGTACLCLICPSHLELFCVCVCGSFSCVY